MAIVNSYTYLGRWDVYCWYTGNYRATSVQSIANIIYDAQGHPKQSAASFVSGERTNTL